LTYTFEPTVTASTILHVSLIFRTGKEVSDVVEIPTEWSGEKLQGVHNLRALSEDTVISDATSIGSKTIHHLPVQQVVLAYDLVKDWTGRFRHPAEFHRTIRSE
jgi:hypothetical protein